MTNSNQSILIAALQNIRGIPAGADAFDKVQKIAHEALESLSTSTPEPDAAVVGYANVHEFNGKNDGFLVVRPAKAKKINGNDTFLTVPIYSAAPAEIMLAYENLRADYEQLKAAASTQQGGERLPYPDGIVTGPCVCGSWPGGECLRCEWKPAARAEGVDAALLGKLRCLGTLLHQLNAQTAAAAVHEAIDALADAQGSK